MKKQIFRSICIAAIVVFFASFVLIMGVLYDYFSSVQMKELETETYIASVAVEKNGEEYLNGISDGRYRITWIDSDGKVLFDNKADSSEMENHLKREEIKKALKDGVGQSTRQSATLTEQQLYCARRLSDGTVLRLSSEHLSWWALAFGMLQPIVIVIAIAVGISLFLAYRLSRRIVKPLNNLNLDEPETEIAYDELSPLLNRISAQKSQLKSQENELKQKKKEFDTATENMREGIILLGENGKVLSINKAASGILNISRYCIGKNLLLFYNTFEMQELLRLSSEGRYIEKRVIIDEKDFQFNASPIITEGKVSGVALILFDVTEKEKTEALRREFTANVSHELKTPLQNISGSAELLASGIVKSEDIPGFASNIFNESKRMISLIDDIIKLSHLDENVDAYTFERTDLYTLAELTHRNLLPIAEKKSIRFTVSGVHAEINGIPSLLSEILYNLCDNAIKYNREGGSVALTVYDMADKSVVSVEDTGIGIPSEEHERIFERFYRVDKSRSKNVGGTGLGLSIVKHAARIHHADIEVRSKLGKGTEIILTFPKDNTPDA